jgi:hypothetical protein
MVKETSLEKEKRDPLENLTWIELKAFGVPVSKVCGHTVASIDGKMLIFGGKLKI